MPVGPILLSVLVILIYFGFGERTLATLGLSARTAIFAAAALLLGGLIDVPVSPSVTVNVGGAVLPVLLALYCLAGGHEEPFWGRGLAAGLAATLSTYWTGRWFPPGQPTELNLFYLDAQYLYALVAGLSGYIVGNSARSAFAGAILGPILADVAHAFRYSLLPVGVPTSIHIGGGGFQLTAVVAGTIAAVLAATLGDAAEPRKSELPGRRS